MILDIEAGGTGRRVETRAGDLYVNGRRAAVDAVRTASGWSFVVSRDTEAPSGCGRSYDVSLADQGPGRGMPPGLRMLLVHVNGRQIDVRLADPRFGTRRTAAAAAASARHVIAAPMPGRVTRVLAQVGDAVAARQGVIVVEAMKMENELRTPRAGVVVELRVAQGALVEAGAVLAVIE